MIFLYQIKGYNCIYQNKSSSNKGGLVIYLRDISKYKVKLNFNTSNIWKGLSIEITGDSLKKKVILGNLYRPPNNILANYRQFIEELNTQIENLINNNHEFILTGDFNIDLLQINNKNIIDKFFDNIISHCLYPAITLPARFSTSNCTLIDNIFCKLLQVTIKSIAGIFNNQTIL